MFVADALAIRGDESDEALEVDLRVDSKGRKLVLIYNVHSIELGCESLQCRSEPAMA